MDVGRRAWLLAVPLLAAVLAGCAEKGVDEDVGRQRDDCEGAVVQQQDVAQPYELTVRVVVGNASGPPIQGVRVAFLVKDPGSSQVLCGEVLATPTSADFVTVALGETNDYGVVIGRILPGAPLRVFVEGAGDFAGEAVTGLEAGEAGTNGQVVVPLLRSTMAVTVDGRMSRFYSPNPHAPTDPTWRSVLIPFHGDPVVQAEYLERLASLDVTLRWNNTVTSYGDLYAGLALGPAKPFYEGSDELQTPEAVPTPHSETLSADATVLDAQREAFVAGLNLAAAAATRKPMDNMDGVAFQFEVTATFLHEPDFGA